MCPCGPNSYESSWGSVLCYHLWSGALVGKQMFMTLREMFVFKEAFRHYGKIVKYVLCVPSLKGKIEWLIATVLICGLVFGELRLYVMTLLCKFYFLVGSSGIAFSVAFCIVGTWLKSRETHLPLRFSLPTGLNSYNICLFLMCQHSRKSFPFSCGFYIA